MNGTRILGAVCAGILATSFGTLVACGGSSDDKASSVDPAVTARTVQAASVMVEIADANGLKVGQSSGTLIAPRLLLTAGHMISGQSKWVITTADGKKVTGSKGMTYDWRSYESDKAHPRHHDVGVIYLDSPIKLDAYPSVVSETSSMSATRIRGTGASFLPVASTIAWNAQQPNSYVTDMPSAESLDIGGALFTANGIVGVVEGKGLTTNKLYMARTDALATWINKKAGCAGASTTTTFAVGAPKQQICDDAGNPIGASSSSSSGSSSGASSSGSTGSTSGASSSGSSGSSGSGTDSGPSACQTDDTDGIDSKSGSGTPTTGLNTSTGPNGASKSTTGGAGTSGTPGDTSGSSNGASSGSSTSTGASSSGNTTTGGAGNNGTNGSTTGSSSGASGSNGSTNGSGTTTGGAGNNGSTTGSTGNSTPVPSTEPCQGPTDNPDTCPPEATSCSGAPCGGSNAEPAGMDFGTCACGTPAQIAAYLK